MAVTADEVEKHLYFVQEEFNPYSHWTSTVVRSYQNDDELDEWTLNEVISRLTWRDHDNGVVTEYHDLNVRASLPMTERELYDTVCYEAEMHRARYDYRYQDLMEIAREGYDQGVYSRLYSVFLAFAALGSRHVEAASFVSQALADERLDSHGRAMLLQGLWLGVHLEDQGELMLTLSDDMIERGEDTDNLYYWRAFAFRRLGRYDEAMDSIDVAMSMISPRSTDIHQDYSRERELIVMSKLLEDRLG